MKYCWRYFRVVGLTSDDVSGWRYLGSLEMHKNSAKKHTLKYRLIDGIVILDQS